MSLLTSSLRATSILTRRTIPSTATTATRAFTTSRFMRSSNHDHGSRYDEPGGWLFGIKPGEKYEKEGWETLWYWGVFGSLGVAIVAYAFKPDTRYVLSL